MKSAFSKIIDLLKERDYSFSELLEIFGEQNLSRKELKEIIDRIVKISKHASWKFYYSPAKCRECGYEVKNYRPITKCPKCKAEKIKDPRYIIKTE
ncbi:MAG: transcriptional regulator [Candidatus Aenigmatarchaeota archaeon]